MAQYEGSIQTAFREVADALSARDALRQQIEAQRRCATPIANASAWPRAPCARRGQHLEMLDAQRSLFESEQEFIRLQQRRLVNAVTLYKALGGWEQGSGAS